MNLPRITIDDIPRLQKRAQYTPDMLPDAISVASENSVSNFSTPYDSPYILHTDDLNTHHVMNMDVPVRGRLHSE